VASNERGGEGIASFPAGPRLAILLDGEGGGRTLLQEEIWRWRSKDGALWIHLDLDDPAARQWLEQDRRLGPLERETLLRRSTQTRVRASRDHLLVALLVPGAEDEEVHSFRSALEPSRALTLHRGPLPALDECAARLARGQGPRDVMDLMAMLLELATAHGEREAVGIDARLVDLEYQADRDPRLALEQLRPIQRAGGRERRAVARQREALAELHREGARWLTEGHEELWRELDARHDDLVTTLDGILERTRWLYDYLQGRLATVLNDRLYLLTLVSAIVLPISFITSLLGVNVGGIPGRQAPWAFAVLLGLLAALAMGQYYLFKWRRWIPPPAAMRGGAGEMDGEERDGTELGRSAQHPGRRADDAGLAAPGDRAHHLRLPHRADRGPAGGVGEGRR
jgi:zinc transporter